MSSGPHLQRGHLPYSVLKKMENLVLAMQHPADGIPVESLKSFMTTVPGTFTVSDFLNWLTKNLNVDNNSEALHLGNFFLQFGYIYPVTEAKLVATLKDDSTSYRFQTPYFWPSLNCEPDHLEYAIYLTKRSLRNRKRVELEEEEQIALSKLQKTLCDKWDFVYSQAQEQTKLLKERKKADRMVIANQEKAFWRIQRPTFVDAKTVTPAQPNSFEVEKHSFKPNRTMIVPKKNIENLTKQVKFYENCLKLPRSKFSKIFESLVGRCQLYEEHDPFLVLPLPSNPWISDDIEMWELDGDLVETPTERRVKRWAFGLMELLSDPAGLREFKLFLDKEFSSENISFWLSVETLKKLPNSKVEKKVRDIYEEFLAKGAPKEINIDSKTMNITVCNLEKPTRLTFDAAQNHIYLLMKKDSYSRFMRSNHYKAILALAYNPSKSKRFFKFGNKKRQIDNSPAEERRGSVGQTKASDGAGTSVTFGQSALHSISAGNLKDLDPGVSKSDDSFRLDTSGKKQTDQKPSPSTRNSKHDAKSQQKVSFADTAQSMFKQRHLDLSAVEAATSSQNVITPWEDEMPENVIAPWEDKKPQNVVAPWEDEMPQNVTAPRADKKPQNATKPEDKKPQNVVAPWEDEMPLNVIAPWEDKKPQNVVAPWEDDMPENVIAPWEGKKLQNIVAPWEDEMPQNLIAPWEDKKPQNVVAPWEDEMPENVIAPWENGASKTVI